MKKVTVGFLVCFGLIIGIVDKSLSAVKMQTIYDYNSTTVQDFDNVPSTAPSSWASINMTTTVAKNVGFTAYASSFSQPTFGRNLVIGTTFNCFDNFIATTIINGYAIVYGTDTLGNVSVDSITFQANSRGVGLVPFIYISSFTVYFTSVSNMNPNTFKIEVGDGVRIGLNSYWESPPLYILENSVRVTSATFYNNNAAFTPRALQNGVNDFKVNYPAQERH
jgi:hypothetical protein